MPFAQNGEVRVHYEVEGSGPPIVLQHGFSDSLESWREYGYVDALAPDHQVILIDARGHGQSDKSYEPEDYSYDKIAADVTSVLDDLSLERVHFLGHSMGARIAFAVARYAPDRLLSVMPSGNSPYNGAQRATDFIAFMANGIQGMVDAWKQLAAISPELEARLLANDVDALVTYMKYRQRAVDDLLDALPRLPCPWKLICSDLDTLAPYSEVAEYATRLPEGSLITLHGLNHLEAFQRSDVVLPHFERLMAQATA